MAFSFGLLHGFGFAGALAEVSWLALLMFDDGVEIGQLLFVAFVLGVRTLLGRSLMRLPAWTFNLPPYSIGTLAMVWVFETSARSGAELFRRLTD